MEFNMPEIRVPSAQEEKLKELQSNVMRDNWIIVFETYKKERTLRMAKITETGDTLLHMAVSLGKEYWVAEMVDLLVSESNSETRVEANEESSDPNIVLSAENNEKNTPLHIAATKGNAIICKKIGEIKPCLITKRNNVGETPLFLAACYGWREAFLWLHHIYAESQGDSLTDFTHCIRDKDTILHCAIAKEHFDVAIEIVLLYKHHLKEMTSMRNKKGLSPLHLLATTSSAFKHNKVVKRLNRWILGVQEKKQATTRQELERRKRIAIPRFYSIHRILWTRFLMESERNCCMVAAKIIMSICLCTLSIPFILVAWLFLVAVPFIFVVSLIIGVLVGVLVSPATVFYMIQREEQRRIWYFQIMEALLQHASKELMSEIISEPLTAPPETKEDKEAGTIIVETPLMIAAKNGAVGMIEMILELFPSQAVEDVNEEGKNVVLLAAENGQTKAYQILCRSKKVDESVFRHVDKDGNTALHLAAKLGLNPNWQATSMIEEYKWFEFVKSSTPFESWEKRNNDGKTAEEIFRDRYKEYMTSDKEWLERTSQTCSVASTLVASMAFSNFAGENIHKKNNSSLVALSLSLTSTITFLAIVAFRSQSFNFLRSVPFMLHFAILTMFGSIVALWISLMLHGQSITTGAILGSPIAILTILSLRIFIRHHTLMSVFTKVPPPKRGTTSAIRYRWRQKKENGTDFERNQKPNPSHTGIPMTPSRIERRRSF